MGVGSSGSTPFDAFGSSSNSSLGTSMDIGMGISPSDIPSQPGQFGQFLSMLGSNFSDNTQGGAKSTLAQSMSNAANLLKTSTPQPVASGGSIIQAHPAGLNIPAVASSGMKAIQGGLTNQMSPLATINPMAAAMYGNNPQMAMLAMMNNGTV